VGSKEAEEDSLVTKWKDTASRIFQGLGANRVKFTIPCRTSKKSHNITSKEVKRLAYKPSNAHY